MKLIAQVFVINICLMPVSSHAITAADLPVALAGFTKLNAWFNDGTEEHPNLQTQEAQSRQRFQAFVGIEGTPNNPPLILKETGWNLLQGRVELGLYQASEEYGVLFEPKNFRLHVPLLNSRRTAISVSAAITDPVGVVLQRRTPFKFLLELAGSSNASIWNSLRRNKETEVPALGYLGVSWYLGNYSMPSPARAMLRGPLRAVYELPLLIRISASKR